MGTDLRPGPGVLVCTFFWDVCVSFLVWAGPVEGLELSLLKKKNLAAIPKLLICHSGKTTLPQLKKEQASLCPFKAQELFTIYSLTEIFPL